MSCDLLWFPRYWSAVRLWFQIPFQWQIALEQPSRYPERYLLFFLMVTHRKQYLGKLFQQTAHFVSILFIYYRLVEYLHPSQKIFWTTPGHRRRRLDLSYHYISYFCQDSVKILITHTLTLKNSLKEWTDIKNEYKQSVKHLRYKYFSDCRNSR